MHFAWQCLLVFVLAFSIDVTAAIHFKSLIGGQVAFAVVTVMAINFLGYFQKAWFIDHRETWRRLAITVAMAIGAGVGTAVIMMW